VRVLSIRAPDSAKSFALIVGVSIYSWETHRKLCGDLVQVQGAVPAPSAAREFLSVERNLPTLIFIQPAVAPVYSHYRLTGEHLFGFLWRFVAKLLKTLQSFLNSLLLNLITCQHPLQFDFVIHSNFFFSKIAISTKKNRTESSIKKKGALSPPPV